MNTKIAVLYGPVGGNTEKVAKLILEKLGAEKCDLIPVKDAKIETISNYNSFIIGGSTIGTHTWSHTNSSEDWDAFLPIFRKADFKGKKVAIFGLGDQLAYPNNFVDDMRIIYDIVIGKEATVIGQVATDAYDYNDSVAIVDDKFIGLPLNEDHEEDLTNERIEGWLASLKDQL
ncbi:MAG: flavodoxin [Salinivirgaceae bacterium]|nr:flavodoxin [Salinivirgaceae bacterium]